MGRLAEHGADPLFVHHPAYWVDRFNPASGELMTWVEQGETTALMAAVGVGGLDPIIAVEHRARVAEDARVASREPDPADVEAVTLEAVKVTVELGVDVNTAGADGNTALHVAAARGQDTVIEYLVENGATLDATNDEGQTPLSLAMAGSRRLGDRYAVPRRSTVELLQRLGAKDGRASVRRATTATDLGVPRSTARGWLRSAPAAVVSLDVADLTVLELQQEVLKRASYFSPDDHSSALDLQRHGRATIPPRRQQPTRPFAAKHREETVPERDGFSGEPYGASKCRITWVWSAPGRGRSFCARPANVSAQ